MRILIDVTHPAHVLFFRAVIPRLRAMGHEIRCTSRDKDVTTALLDAFGIEHECISKAGATKLGLLAEIFRRDWRLLRVVREFRPDVILAKHGLYASHAGWLAGVPTISFDDTDTAPIQQTLYFRFAWRIYTDRAYRTPIGAKQRLYDAVSPLAYLHPSVFTPDDEVLRRAGIDPAERRIICRLVNWNSNHDIGHHGFNRVRLPQMLETLARHGRVIISSETPLPAELEKYRFRQPPQDLHHFLAGASLYFGESATMATEAAVLGVPTVHVSSHNLWFTQKLEQHELMHNTKDAEQGLLAAVKFLEDPHSLAAHRERRDRYLEQTDDLVSVIVDTLDEVPERSVRRECLSV